MKLKVIAIEVPALSIIDTMNAFIDILPNILRSFRSHDLPGQEEIFLDKPIIIWAMITIPDAPNIDILINNDFLSRVLPKFDRNTELHELYLAENHMANIELLCLIKTLKECWQHVTGDQKKNIIQLLINKTEETLNPDAAECFTLTLKRTIDWLIAFQPELATEFEEITAKRRAYYASVATSKTTGGA